MPCSFSMLCRCLSRVCARLHGISTASYFPDVHKGARFTREFIHNSCDSVVCFPTVFGFLIKHFAKCSDWLRKRDLDVFRFKKAKGKRFCTWLPPCTVLWTAWWFGAWLFNKMLALHLQVIFYPFLLNLALSFNLAGFLAHVQQFSRLLDKLEVWVSCEAVWDIMISFSVWFFKMEFNHLRDLLNTGFTIVEIGLFYSGKHLGAKICRLLTCLRSLQDGDSVLNRGLMATPWKHFR